MSKSLFFAFVGILLLSACGQQAPVVRSQRQEQAIDLNQKAERAYLRGEYSAASDLYVKALQLDVAIENVGGISANLLNLAKVSAVMGKMDMAQRYLDRLLQDAALQYPVSHKASAALQYGSLRLRSGDGAGAAAWADKAAEYCVSDCALAGSIANLKANIAIHANDVEHAKYWGERAVASNKAGAQVEYANALRLFAHAKLLGQEAGGALPILEEALAIDKRLGIPEKIRLDLELLAEAHDKLGKAELAAQYRERSARVAAASR